MLGVSFPFYFLLNHKEQLCWCVCHSLPLVLKLLRGGGRTCSEVESELGEEPPCASKESKRGTEQHFASLYSEVRLSK